jgi:hypothetical protein
MPFSSYLQNKLVDHAFGSGTFTKPTLYLALTVDGTEVSTSGGTNYARKATAAFTVSSNTASLAADVDFDVAGTDWGTINGVALYDAVSGGNLLGTGTLSESKLIETGDIFRALAGEIDITLT